MDKPLLMTFSDEEAGAAMDNDGTINPGTEYVAATGSGPISITPDHKRSAKSNKKPWNSWNSKYYCIIQVISICYQFR